MEPMVTIALRAARRAGQLIVQASEQLDRLDVEEKGTNDFVSEVDRSAEREIIQQLQRAYPDHRIIAEESGLNEARGNDSGHVWYIDPLDGTTNFLRGIGHYAVSLACAFRGRVEHAVIYDPVRDESFSASRGRGAQCNGRRIRVSARPSLDGALLGTGIPFKSRQQHHLEAYCESLKELASQTAGIRRAGAAALDLAYVAAGRLDAFWEIGLQPWDIAAGSLLVTEAGGLVSDFGGGHDYLESGNIVCGNPKCFKATLQVVHQHLGHIALAKKADNAAR